MGLFNLFKPAKTVLVIDALSLNESMGMKGKVPPRNQLQILRRLSRFAQREKLEVIAVLSGTPLNKAPVGEKFEEIVVLYSKSLETHAKFLAQTALSKGSGAILVSGNSGAEKVAGTNVKKLRVSTFRKAFDVGGDTEGNGGEGASRPRGNRPPRRRQSKPQGGGAGNNGNTNNNGNNNNKGNNPNSDHDHKNAHTEQKRERQPKQMTETDAINELIDLVD